MRNIFFADTSHLILLDILFVLKVGHFDLISNIFCVVMQVELLELNFWHSAELYRSGRARA